MGRTRARRTIAVLSSAGTLAGVDPILARAGVRVLRVPAVASTPVPWQRWRARLDRSPSVDVVLVTSRRGVADGVVPWLQHTPAATRAVQFWAGGPATARALRAAGVRRVRRPSSVGSASLGQSFATTPARTILYFRSDRAGPALARSLRQNGHRVLDLVVYRLRPPPGLAARACAALAAAPLWVATSPSSLKALRGALGSRRFADLARRTSLVVLGERTREAARRHGFGRVSVVPPTTAQRFARRLLSELRDA